jgi:hypothetical protein
MIPNTNPAKKLLQILPTKIPPERLRKRKTQGIKDMTQDEDG